MTQAASRSRSPAPSVKADGVLAAAASALALLCERHDVPVSHGAGHAQRVLEHVERALEAADASGRALGENRRLAVRLAALLHDADDRKYFPGSPKGEHPNAKLLMQQASAPPGVVDEGLRMISLVSCSANGNSVPPDAREQPELLWPRWADRLEATGEIGVVRCWQYNTEVGAPSAVEETPRPASAEEVWALATDERFAEYQRSGGGSRSMMDHYYDKLLRVSRPDFSVVRNKYLEAEMERRAEPLVAICLEYGRTGRVPEETIRAMAARCGC